MVVHQNLAQFERELLASVMASTAIKLVGGMSATDLESPQATAASPAHLQALEESRVWEAEMTDCVMSS